MTYTLVIGHVHIHKVLHGVLYSEAHNNGLQKTNQNDQN